MSGFVPMEGRGAPTDPEHPHLLEIRHDREELRARWAVRAAQWRAWELAEAVFGGVADSSLHAPRSAGPARGLLVLEVPFVDLDRHRELEARFMAAAVADPVLAQVPLVYVFGAAGV
ncbi:MAG: hypothetical protein U5R14_08320 [Gemmatimonadota bacterium]|nr:hypothetical protein [Gemmatimonadota bacterium]